MTEGICGRGHEPPEAKGNFLEIFVLFWKKIAILVPFTVNHIWQVFKAI